MWTAKAVRGTTVGRTLLSKRLISGGYRDGESGDMSVYEGLSLALSTFGTMATVFIGFRQLRQAVPAARATTPAYYAAPAYGHGPGYGPGQPPGQGAAPTPGRMEYGRAPVVPPPPYGAPPTHGWPPAYAPPSGYMAPGRPGARPRPGSVRLASIFLFLAAALQPVTMIAYYGLEYTIDSEAASTDVRNSGAADLTIFAIVAVLCGLLGILIARGNRVAAWLVWVFGALAVPFAALAFFGLLLQMVNPDGETPVGLLVVVMLYLLVVSFALAASAVLLLNSKARTFFFQRA